MYEFSTCPMSLCTVIVIEISSGDLVNNVELDLMPYYMWSHTQSILECWA
jgi:hypothetical protein